LNRAKLYKAISYFTVFVSLLSVSIFLLSSLNLWAQSQDSEAVFFDSDTNSITQESIEVLNRKANSLQNTPEFTITLEGYSDITGRADYNLGLSKKRAQLVKDYLVDIGIDPNNIKVVGKGGTEKYGAGEAREALLQNRRVNLIVDIPITPAMEVENQEIENLSQEQEPEVIEEPANDIISEEPAIQIATSSPQPVSEDLSNNIEREIRQNASDGIIFITPIEMQIGQTYTVEAEVSNSFLEALSKDLTNIKLENELGIKLSGKGFDINPYLENDEEIKTIDNTAPTKWEWYVTPLANGFNSLILSTQVIPEGSADKGINPKYETFQRVIDVKPNLIHYITSSYWIMGILSALIIAVVAWILIRKVRLN
jgi:hypothetical protein